MVATSAVKTITVGMPPSASDAYSATSDSHWTLSGAPSIWGALVNGSLSSNLRWDAIQAPRMSDHMPSGTPTGVLAGPMKAAVRVMATHTWRIVNAGRP